MVLDVFDKEEHQVGAANDNLKDLLAPIVCWDSWLEHFHA
jgi:hypothetical protein